MDTVVDRFYLYKSYTYVNSPTPAPMGAVDNLHTTFRFFLPDSVDRGISILTAKCVSYAVHRQNDQEP